MDNKEGSSVLDKLKKYIEFECEKFGDSPEETTSYSRVKKFIDYRNIRTEQAWMSYMHRDTKIDRKNFSVLMSKLDKERRYAHTHALTGMLGFNSIFEKFGEEYGLEKLYEGPLLTNDEIRKCPSSAYDTRMEMTDWFLGVIEQINGIDNIEISKNGKTNFIEELQQNVRTNERGWGVKENLKTYEGDVIFNDVVKKQRNSDYGGYSL